MGKKDMGRERALSFEDAVQVWLIRWGGALQSRIAALFETNQGRISEILTGKRWLGSRDEAERRRGRN